MMSWVSLVGGLVKLANWAARLLDVRRWTRAGYEKAELEARRQADADRKARDALDEEISDLDDDAVRERMRRSNDRGGE